MSDEADNRDVRVQRSPAKTLGGTIHYALEVERIATNGTRESSANFEIDAELVFNAGGGATLTLDGDHHFTIAFEPPPVRLFASCADPGEHGAKIQG